MTIFDLAFLVVALGTVAALAMSVLAALGGRHRRAARILGGLAVFLAAYLGLVVVVSLASPPRVLEMKEPQCSDDWCIAVDHVEQSSTGASRSYVVTLRVFSRARGRPQRERGVGVVLVDGQGRRFLPVDDPPAVPLDVRLAPGESVLATRRFTLPPDAHDLGLVVTRPRFPGVFIVADAQSLLHEPTVVRLP
jgi:hypothetical protein